jgi:uncharacterized hydrophobic protein (TIGR00271 family)
VPRTIQITAQPDAIDRLLIRLDQVPGVCGVARHRRASIDPPGDVLELQASNDTARKIFELLAEVEDAQQASIVTSEPKSILSPSHRQALDVESSETTLDETAFHLRHETNVTQNYMILMALAGAVASAGLWTDKLHVVIGAMIIAPAFEPFVRIPFGFVAGPMRIARGGAFSLVAGYAAMAAAAFLTTHILWWIQPGSPLELTSRQWVRYWSTTDAPSVLISAFASIAGVIVVCGLRSVLTTGVMIALALIPSLSLTGMAMAIQDWSLAGNAFWRWLVDALLVTLAAAIVLKIKQRFRFRGRSLS